ncbi:hypothetical protein AVEN_219980-1 [Araneus ventricosus]|uniref:Uncharacterized protein n=1 Tax=Araneus ventricosus TaxID=182803 RepID=A0A4Y2PX48_ARAVE|nr:hypothetical protein AVEN_3606-1 [Araneus ventricosus]GBN55080.1 hypothetical protein AVEN_261205-1 [Araneus ventricosus]GBN55110.1 hypothetical protein AVEN_109554-1 [Araneus ventricosus]GBN55150.1 hypothetical protein AVEN_219980-1 [Araneus ventricosus]
MRVCYFPGGLSVETGLYLCFACHKASSNKPDRSKAYITKAHTRRLVINNAGYEHTLRTELITFQIKFFIYASLNPQGYWCGFLMCDTNQEKRTAYANLLGK